MDFGKTTQLETVDFSLPGDPAFTRNYLSSLPPLSGPMHLYLGATGWAMPQWVGRWYPAGTKSKDHLYHYGRQFSTIELNTTHYRIPDFSTIGSWCERVPQDFRFCPKLPQTISHDKQLGLNGSATRLFTEAIAGMGQRLGVCFLQLPPHFGPDRLPLLEIFLQKWPQALPLAVEVRHEDWFADERATNKLASLLHGFGTGMVITDVAGRRDVLHQFITAPFVLIRFVGNGLHPTDYLRVDSWAERLHQWAGQGLPEVYFFSHQPDNILSPEMVLYLWAKIRSDESLRARPPAPLSVSGNDPQMQLF